MFVKMMSKVDMPDNQVGKPYTTHECSKVAFYRVNGDWMAEIDGDPHLIDGNVYVLNNSGKTIDSFWPS